jgi:hypothetical protein
MSRQSEFSSFSVDIQIFKMQWFINKSCRVVLTSQSPNKTWFFKKLISLHGYKSVILYMSLIDYNLLHFCNVIFITVFSHYKKLFCLFEMCQAILTSYVHSCSYNLTLWVRFLQPSSSCFCVKGITISPFTNSFEG